MLVLWSVFHQISKRRVLLHFCFLPQNISKELIQRNFCYKAPNQQREIRIFRGQMVGMVGFLFAGFLGKKLAWFIMVLTTSTAVFLGWRYVQMFFGFDGSFSCNFFKQLQIIVLTNDVQDGVLKDS